MNSEVLRELRLQINEEWAKKKVDNGGTRNPYTINELHLKREMVKKGL